MNGSNSNTNSSPAPFLLKTYEMVDDRSTNAIVSWSQTGYSFVVWNPPEFARDLLPKYFKHNNFSSFIRQLNTYTKTQPFIGCHVCQLIKPIPHHLGFRKVDPDQWEFANEEFIRGRIHLLKNIHRRKPIHSHSSSQANPLTSSERDEYEKEIDRLKKEKLALESEVERHRRDNQEYESRLIFLQQTLHDFDHRHRQLMRSLSELFHKPESFNKRRRLLALNYLNDDENPNVTSREESNRISTVNLELMKKLDSSLTSWEHFVEHNGADYAAADRSPDISSICIDTDYSSPKTLSIDVNSSPVKISQVERSGSGENDGYALSVANDVFWEQFLTEVPATFITDRQ